MAPMNPVTRCCSTRSKPRRVEPLEQNDLHAGHEVAGRGEPVGVVERRRHQYPLRLRELAVGLHHRGDPPEPRHEEPGVLHEDHLGRAGGTGAAHTPTVGGDDLGQRVRRGRTALLEHVQVIGVDHQLWRQGGEHSGALPVGQVPPDRDHGGAHLPGGETAHEVLGGVADAHCQHAPQPEPALGEHPRQLRRPDVELLPGHGAHAAVLGGEHQPYLTRTLLGHLADPGAVGNPALDGRRPRQRGHAPSLGPVPGARPPAAA